MKKKHITPNYLLNPTHPVTVTLIGCGGTGSQVLTCLGRISHSLQQLGHPGFHVRVYDADIVTQANIGRQLFTQDDPGMNKAVVLTTRINRFFGTSWEAVPEFYNTKTAEGTNITVSCVDTVKSRLDISDILVSFEKKNRKKEPYLYPYYWLDFGNTTDSGQIVLGTISELKQPESKKYKTTGKLPMVTERFNLSLVDERDSGPSCSLAEALKKQNLFINSSLAHLGSDLLWRIFSEGMIDNAGLYLNLRTYAMNAMVL